MRWHGPTVPGPLPVSSRSQLRGAPSANSAGEGIEIIRPSFGEGPGFERASIGVPKGIRTPVTAVKGRCPGPLDDGDAVRPPGGRGRLHGSRPRNNAPGPSAQGRPPWWRGGRLVSLRTYTSP